MAKGKDVRVILECTNCVRNSVTKESPGISRYYSKESTQDTQSIGIEKILPILLQAYNSWGNKEIDRTELPPFPVTRTNYI